MSRNRRRQVLDGDEALVELRRLLDLLHERRRDHLAGLVVLRVDLQHLGLEAPVLHDLRRHLDEVAREAGQPSGTAPCRRNPCSAWPNSWNSVFDLFQRQQRRLVARRPREVADVGHDRADHLAVADVAAAQAAGPRARRACRGAGGSRSGTPPGASPSASFTSYAFTSGW